MRHEFADGSSVVLGDSAEVVGSLPDGSVDMVLTDPPYGMSFRSNYRKERHEAIENDSDLGWVDAFASESYRVAADDTAHFVFCSHHRLEVFKSALARVGFDVVDVLVWVKNNTSMGSLEYTFAPKCEFVLHLMKGRRRIEGRRTPNVLEFDRTGNHLHPTQKPVDLLEHLIRKFSSEDDLIFDPFAGSGSTGVAAQNTGRRFLLVEKDETYFRTAVDRLSAGSGSEGFF